MKRVGALVAALVTVAACHQRAEAVQTRAAVTDLVQQSMPRVEEVMGLKFKHKVGVEIRTRAQIRDYVIHKLDQDIPRAEFASREAALKHLALIPDSLDLRSTMVDVLSEQIAGYYDPDSGALFIPTDADSTSIRFNIASHELVHALQDQYASIDSVLRQPRHNDREEAGAAIFEGQATLAQIQILMPEQQMATVPSFWDTRSAVAMQQEQMPVFAHAPLWVKQTLIFPYLAGADFVRWFETKYPGQQPYGKNMPVSSSQILHPERYAAHETPVNITIRGGAGDVLQYDDDLGEFETRLVLEQALGSEDEAEALTVGWAGDHYAVLGAHNEALVWYAVWRTPAAASAFVSGLKRAWAKRAEPGKTWRAERTTLGTHPASVVTYAPSDWSGWTHPPTAAISAK
ncbi:MAG TPA: hypothetical protein VN674_12055 [Gemmatimonadales bacterium]|nr:hypothetical protein [Gemmatimonadales bacterium]